MKYYWHVHHDILCESSGNIEERIEWIKNNKPQEEIELRLRLLREVKGKLPEAYKTAQEAYKITWNAYKMTWNTYKTAQEAYKTAQEAYKITCKAYETIWKAYKEEIEKLHKKECPGCPWNDSTIFLA